MKKNAASKGAKKNDRKRADALVNDGVKAMENGNSARAESIFTEALSICKDLPDALYNLGVLILEDIDIKIEGNEVFDHHGQMIKAFEKFDRIIALDTSRRGETTGLAHRAKANALRQFLEFCHCGDRVEAFVTEALACYSRAIEILSATEHLDNCIFELAQFRRDIFNKQCLANSVYASAGGTLLTPAAAVALFVDALTVCNTISDSLASALQTSYTSGIDRDVIIFHAELLVDCWTYVLPLGRPGSLSANLEVLRGSLVDQVMALIALMADKSASIVTLCELMGDHDIETSVLGADLCQCVLKWALVMGDDALGRRALEGALRMRAKALGGLASLTSSSSSSMEGVSSVHSGDSSRPLVEPMESIDDVRDTLAGLGDAFAELGHLITLGSGEVGQEGQGLGTSLIALLALPHGEQASGILTQMAIGAASTSTGAHASPSMLRTGGADGAPMGVVAWPSPTDAPHAPTPGPEVRHMQTLTVSRYCYESSLRLCAWVGPGDGCFWSSGPRSAIEEREAGGGEGGGGGAMEVDIHLQRMPCSPAQRVGGGGGGDGGDLRSGNASDDSGVFASEVAYNLACVCWRMGDRDGCRLALVHAAAALQLRRDAMDGGGRLDLVSRMGHEACADPDLNGISTEPWFTELFHL